MQLCTRAAQLLAACKFGIACNHDAWPHMASQILCWASGA